MQYNTLHLVVWAKSLVGEDTYLGEVNVDLTSIPSETVVDQWFELQPYSGSNFKVKIPAGALTRGYRGELRLIILWEEEEETLVDKGKGAIAATWVKGVDLVKAWTGKQ